MGRVTECDGDVAQERVEWLLISGQSDRQVSHSVADMDNGAGSNNKSLGMEESKDGSW
jgi:hypothetical protein